jgi:hypothetical protein
MLRNEASIRELFIGHARRADPSYLRMAGGIGYVMGTKPAHSEGEITSRRKTYEVFKTS